MSAALSSPTPMSGSSIAFASSTSSYPAPASAALGRCFLNGLSILVAPRQSRCSRCGRRTLRFLRNSKKHLMERGKESDWGEETGCQKFMSLWPYQVVGPLIFAQVFLPTVSFVLPFLGLNKLRKCAKGQPVNNKV